MIRVNLLKSERKEAESRLPAAEKPAVKKQVPLGQVILLAAVAGIGLLIILQARATKREAGLLAAAQTEYQQLRPVLAKLEEVSRQRDMLRKKIDLITQLKALQPLPVEILTELSQDLPEWVWLTEATFVGSSITIRGKALSNVLLSDYIRALEQSRVFEAVGVINSTQRTAGSSEYLEFTLQAVIIPPGGPPPAAAPGRK